MIYLIIVIFLHNINVIYSLTYEDARIDVLKSEDALSTGGELILNSKESYVNDILMNFKFKELIAGFNEPEKLAPARHFFKAKSVIDNSNTFKMLRRMPKGSLLHIHNTAAVSSEWVIQNLTYYPELFKCINKKGVVLLTFRKSSDHECASYVKISDERKKAISTYGYDQELEKLINLYSLTPEVEYEFIQNVWLRFQNMFTTTKDLIMYLPAFRAYHWRLLEEMYEDGVFYIELRISFSEGYDGTEKIYKIDEMIQELFSIVEKFKLLQPDFIGLKLILTMQRKAESKFIAQQLQKFNELYEKFPNFVIGFDLVGQEDLGDPLYKFVNVLQNLPKGAKYFFHAGETNWYSGGTDTNILDALLLNTTRIGHGYALLKHPILLKTVKNRNIAIEISPISNQVLKLVSDLRNHPASYYISENVPIIISNDDPGYWNAKGLSYDFYYALMSFGSVNAGLKLLKKLVWDSVRYSILNELENHKALIILERKWSFFLDNIINSSNKK